MLMDWNQPADKGQPFPKMTKRELDKAKRTSEVDPDVKAEMRKSRKNQINPKAKAYQQFTQLFIIKHLCFVLFCKFLAQGNGLLPHL